MKRLKSTRPEPSLRAELRRLRAEVITLNQQMSALLMRDQIDRLMARVTALESAVS